MLNLIIATIALLISIAVIFSTFYTEHEQPIDPRIVDRPYGRVFRSSLPPMPVTRVAQEAESFLRRIAGVAPAAAATTLARVPLDGEPA